MGRTTNFNRPKQNAAANRRSKQRSGAAKSKMVQKKAVVSKKKARQIRKRQKIESKEAAKSSADVEMGAVPDEVNADDLTAAIAKLTGASVQ